MIFEYQSLRINYEIIGDGKPFLLLHGLGADLRLMKSCIEPVFTTLTGYQRIYVDLPGMGESTSDSQFASSDRVLEVLTAFVRDKIKDDFLMAGQSYGGYLARGILNNFPEKVSGMALICPVAIAWHKERNLPVTDFRVEDKEYLATLSPEKQAELRQALVFINEKNYALCQEFEDSFEKANLRFIEELRQKYAFSFDVDAQIKEKNYQKPVLMLTGKQDTITGYQDVWNLIESYPRATFAVLDIAGHALQIDQKDLFEVLLKDWLRRTEIKS